MGKLAAITFALPIKKRVFSEEKKSRKVQINFGDKIKTTTFALPIKKGAKSTV